MILADDDPDGFVDHPDPMDYQDLVKQIAWGFRRCGPDLDDLISEGQIGLIELCNQIGDSRYSRAHFRSIAVNAISRAIGQSLHKSTHLISIPWSEWRLFKRIEDGEIDLGGLTQRQNDVILAIQDHISKNLLYENNLKDCRLADLVFYNEGESLYVSLVDDFYDGLNALDARQFDVVVSRFGLDGQLVQTFKEIGSRYGIGKEQARNILDLAIQRLRGHFGVAENPEQAVGQTGRAVKKVGDPARRFSGVYYRPQRWQNPWRSMIFVEGKLRQIGDFPTEEEAAEAYDREARKLGRPVNFPRDGEQQAVAGRCGGKKGSKLRKNVKVT